MEARLVLAFVTGFLVALALAALAGLLLIGALFPRREASDEDDPSSPEVR